jgi:hypothetical protein
LRLGKVDASREVLPPPRKNIIDFNFQLANTLLWDNIVDRSFALSRISMTLADVEKNRMKLLFANYLEMCHEAPEQPSSTS